MPEAFVSNWGNLLSATRNFAKILDNLWSGYISCFQWLEPPLYFPNYTVQIWGPAKMGKNGSGPAWTSHYSKIWQTFIDNSLINYIIYVVGNWEGLARWWKVSTQKEWEAWPEQTRLRWEAGKCRQGGRRRQHRTSVPFKDQTRERWQNSTALPRK